MAANDALDLSMTVRDISLGGFAVEAPLRFAHGEAHEFVLQLSNGTRLPVRARSVYCYAKRDREHQFITGWEALGDPGTARAMARLVDEFLALEAGSGDPVAEGQTPAYHEGPPTTGSPAVPVGSTRIR